MLHELIDSHFCCPFSLGNVNRYRHIKSVKIGLSLFVIFILSLLPELYVANFGGPISGYFHFSFYINNIANFFIYLIADEKFREKLKISLMILFKRLNCKLLCSKIYVFAPMTQGRDPAYPLDINLQVFSIQTQD